MLFKPETYMKSKFNQWREITGKYTKPGLTDIQIYGKNKWVLIVNSQTTDMCQKPAIFNYFR